MCGFERTVYGGSEQRCTADPVEKLRRLKSRKTLKMRLLSKLIWGMVLCLAGVGMLVGAPFVEDPEGMFITGGICTAVGAALLVAFFVGKKWMKPEIESEEKGQASKYWKETEEK